jgi:hypothetical protein
VEDRVGAAGRRRRVFGLSGSALSVSAAHGRSFQRDGRDYGHVIDPSTGWPSDTADAAVVTGPRSLECDALSTALLVLGPDWLPTLGRAFPATTGSPTRRRVSSAGTCSADLLRVLLARPGARQPSGPAPRSHLERFPFRC